MPNSFAQKKKGKKNKAEVVEPNTTQGEVVPQGELERQALFIEGMEQKILGNIKDAVGIFQTVLRLDSKNHAAHYELARILYENAEFSLAEEHAQAAVELDPYNEWYYIYLAEAKAQQGDYEGAAETYEQLLKYLPKYDDYSFDLAYMWSKAGKLDKALAVYQDLEKQFGIQESIILQKEAIYIEMGKIDDAAKEVNKLIDEYPTEFRYIGVLGELYEANDRLDEAEKAYNDLLKLDPNNPDALMALAYVYKKQGDDEKHRKALDNLFGNDKLDIDSKVLLLLPQIQGLAFDNSNGEEVLANADRIVEAHPDDPRSYTAKGDVLLYLDRIPDSKEQYLKAVGLGDCPSTVWNQLLAVLADQDDNDELIKYAEKASKEYPDEIAPKYYKGVALVQLKKYKEAIESFNSVLPDLDNNPEMKVQILSMLGDAYNEVGDAVQSDYSFDEALVLDPNNAYILNNYSYYLSLRGEKLEKAKRMSRKSNILVEDNAAFQDTYAWVLYKAGEYKEAKVWMEKALSNVEGEDRPVLLEHYGDILFKLGKVTEAVDNWQSALDAGGEISALEYKISNKALPK